MTPLRYQHHVRAGVSESAFHLCCTSAGVMGIRRKRSEGKITTMADGDNNEDSNEMPRYMNPQEEDEFVRKVHHLTFDSKIYFKENIYSYYYRPIRLWKCTVRSFSKNVA